MSYFFVPIGLDPKGDVTKIFDLPTSTRRLRPRNTGKGRGAKRKMEKTFKPYRCQRHPEPGEILRMQFSWKFHLHMHQVVGKIISADGKPIIGNGSDPRLKHVLLTEGNRKYHSTCILLEKLVGKSDGSEERVVTEWWPPVDGLPPLKDPNLSGTIVKDGRRYFANLRNSFNYTLLAAICFLSPNHTAHYLVKKDFEKFDIDTSATRDHRNVDWLGYCANRPKDGTRTPWLIMKLQQKGTHVSLCRVDEMGETLPRLDASNEPLADPRVYLPFRPSESFLLEFLGEEQDVMLVNDD